MVIHVSSVGATESHDLIVPKRFIPSRLSRWLMRKSPSKVASEMRAFPGFLTYWSDMKREAPDVVVVRGVTRWFSRVAAVCAVLQRRKLVVYDQEDIVPAGVTTRIRRSLLHAVGVPHFSSRLPLLETPKRASHAIPIPFACPIDDAADGAAPISMNWPPRILMVAKYRERKGHKNLLRALADVAVKRQFFVTFCGEETSDEDLNYCNLLMELAISLGIGDRLRFMNNVPYTEMRAVYRSHDLFVLPSVNEPAAVAPIEAAWNNCCVLISRGSGTRGYIPPDPAFEFNARDVADIARAIDSVIRNPRLLAQMRDQCWHHISKVASNEAILSRFEEFLS